MFVALITSPFIRSAPDKPITNFMRTEGLSLSDIGSDEKGLSLNYGSREAPHLITVNCFLKTVGASLNQ